MVEAFSRTPTAPDETPKHSLRGMSVREAALADKLGPGWEMRPVLGVDENGTATIDIQPTWVGECDDLHQGQGGRNCTNGSNGSNSSIAAAWS